VYERVILHLQFDLVYPQLVQHLSRGFRRKRLKTSG
jgi:hypothetical protein